MGQLCPQTTYNYTNLSCKYSDAGVLPLKRITIKERFVWAEIVSRG